MLKNDLTRFSIHAEYFFFNSAPKMDKVKPSVCQQDVNIKLYSHDVILKVPSNKNFRLPSLCELDPFPNILHSLRVQRFLFCLLMRLFFPNSNSLSESQIYLAVSSQAFHRFLSPTSSKIESRVLSQGLVKIVVFSLKHSANKSFFIYIPRNRFKKAPDLYWIVFLSSFGSCTLLKHQCFRTMI